MISPKRLAYLEQRERDREAAARAPRGWLDRDVEAARQRADDAVRGLIMPLEKLAAQHRRYNREFGE